MVFEMVQRTTQACFEGLAAARNSQCKVDSDPPLVCLRVPAFPCDNLRRHQYQKWISASAHARASGNEAVVLRSVAFDFPSEFLHTCTFESLEE
jgi:hypothetical protein